MDAKESKTGTYTRYGFVRKSDGRVLTTELLPDYDAACMLIQKLDNTGEYEIYTV